MLKRLLPYSITCLLIALTTSVVTVRASHIVAVNITSECLNPCTTRVHLHAYRDCTGASAISNTVTFSATAPGCNVPSPVSNWSTQVTTEVTPICPSISTQCTTPSATINGVQEYYWYRDYNVCGLGANCTFDVTWGNCCRNGIITSGAANQGTGISNHMDVSLGCNNSPQFSNYPLFLACAGQPYTIHQGAYDPDGDSLVFGLTACQTDAFNAVTYNAGYSPTTPLGPSWTVSLDPTTGMMQLTPTPGNVVVGVICFTVDEYRSGNLIGSTVRDMQVQVMNCPANTQPTFTPITNLSTGATLISSDVISWCGTGQLCFDIGATDADTSGGQTVTLSWDQNIPGATFTEVGNPSVQNSISGNSPDGRFCWTPPSTPGTYQFLLTAEDNFCPIPSVQDKFITIIVGGNVSTSLITETGTLDTCAGTTVTLDAGGGYSSYAWSTLALTQSITVSAAGTYSVTVSNGGTCSFTDSYTVVDQSVPEISGTITTSSSAPLMLQKVYLIRHDASNASLHAEDSTYTDSTGFYSFCGVTLDTMYIKAAPDSASYPTEMPTYADTAIWFNNAAMVLATSFPTVKNFSTRFGANPGGPGFLGGLISQGANKTNGPGDPVPDVAVILYSNTLGQIVDITQSDANGYFSFGDIPLGDYEVSVDVPGVDHVLVPSVVLDAATPSMDSLDFRLHTTYFELVVATSILPPAPGSVLFEAFPNPANGSSTIRLDLPAEDFVDLTVYDIRGARLARLANGAMDKGEHRWTLDAREMQLEAGVYFIHLRTRQENKVIKLMMMD